MNVGVALFSSDARFTGALCRVQYGRIKSVFPQLNGDAFRSTMRHIQAEFRAANERLGEELSLSDSTTVIDIARRILPPDDSSLQWSPIGSGLSSDVESELRELYERMVTRYDAPQASERRSDDDVWRNFKRPLETRRVLSRLKPKKIAVQDDEVVFDYAWKNGTWHCLEPVSFDLRAADSIKEKAHKWLGQIQSVKGAGEPFRIYFLVGKPTDESLIPAFENALSILRKVPVDSELCLEEDAPALAERIARDINDHDAAAGH
jgi:hypothetical protein